MLKPLGLGFQQGVPRSLWLAPSAAPRVTLAAHCRTSLLTKNSIVEEQTGSIRAKAGGSLPLGPVCVSGPGLEQSERGTTNTQALRRPPALNGSGPFGPNLSRDLKDGLCGGWRLAAGQGRRTRR